MDRYPTRIATVLAVTVLLVIALAWVGLGDDRSDRAPTTAPRSVGSGATRPVFSASPSGRMHAEPPEPPPARMSGSLPAVRILRGWDHRRSRAYARGDLAAVAALYVPGSRASASDVALLRSYLRRGLRVEGLATQILAVDVLLRARTRLRLRSTDRVRGAVAVGASTRVVLPRDQASTRVISLRRPSADVAWRVSDVSR